MPNSAFTRRVVITSRSRRRCRAGGTVYYMGEGANAPGFVELIPATPGMDEMFTRYWRASVDWDGKEPIRPFG